MLPLLALVLPVVAQDRPPELGFLARTLAVGDVAWDHPGEDRLELFSEVAATAGGQLAQGRWFLEVRGEHLVLLGLPEEGGDLEAAWSVLPGESGWQGPLGPVWLRGGLLVERWGRLDLLPVSDAWNPLDLRLGPLTPVDRLRVPVPTLAAELGSSSLRGTLLVGPFPGSDRAVLWGTDWSLLRPGMVEQLLVEMQSWEGDPLTESLLQGLIGDVATQVEDLDPSTRRGLVGGLSEQGRPQAYGINGDVGLRVQGELPGVDGALTAANLRSRQPLSTLDPSLREALEAEELPGLTELQEGVGEPLSSSWPRTWLLAGELGTLLGTVGLRAEGAWRSHEVVRQPWLSSTTSPSLRLGVGLDRAFGSWLLVILEGRWSRLLDAPEELWLSREDDLQLAATARLSLLRERVQVQPVVVHNLSFAETVVRLDLGWRVSDEVQLGVGGLLLAGGPPAPDTLHEAMAYTGGPVGYWGDNDALMVRASWIR